MQQRLDAQRAPDSVEANPGSVTPAADFVARLPGTQATHSHLSLVRRAAEAHSVELWTLNASEQASAPGSLGRLGVEAGLRGGYVAVKSVLADVMARESGRVLLQQLSLRRIEGGVLQVEARLQLTWLSRPVLSTRSVAVGEGR